MADDAGSVSARVLELAKDSILDEALAGKKTSQLLDLAKGLGCLQDDVARAVDDEYAKGELTKIVQTKATSIVERAAVQSGLSGLSGVPTVLVWRVDGPSSCGEPGPQHNW